MRESLAAAGLVWSEYRSSLRVLIENQHAVTELRALWLDLIGRLSAHVAAGIEYERTAGHAHADTDSLELPTALVEGTARCFHLAGLGIDDNLPSERRITGALSSLWLGAIYGGCGMENPL